MPERNEEIIHSLRKSFGIRVTLSQDSVLFVIVDKSTKI